MGRQRQPWRTGPPSLSHRCRRGHFLPSGVHGLAREARRSYPAARGGASNGSDRTAPVACLWPTRRPPVILALVALGLVSGRVAVASEGEWLVDLTLVGGLCHRDKGPQPGDPSLQGRDLALVLQGRLRGEPHRPLPRPPHPQQRRAPHAAGRRSGPRRRRHPRPPHPPLRRPEDRGGQRRRLSDAAVSRWGRSGRPRAWRKPGACGPSGRG